MRKGFTVLEVVIVVGIIAVISSVGLISLSRYKGGQDVELMMSEIVAALRETQRRSITEQSGNQWGMRFSNSSSSYEVFSGSSYSTSSVDAFYGLRRNITFGNPATSTLDLIFSAISGKLGNNQVISLVNQRKDGLVGDITLTSRGTITNRLEHGLVGYWHFDEATSTITYDASGNDNNGLFVNTPDWEGASSCKAGGCLSFNGVNERVNVSAPLQNFPTEKITVMAWVKVPSHVDWYDYVRNNWAGIAGAWLLYSDSSGNARFGIINDSLAQRNALGCLASFTANSWHHLVGTYDGSDVRVYLDGVQCATTASLSNQTLYTGGAIQFGEWGSAGASTHYIDEIRIYNRALSAAEILNLYNDLK